MGEYLSFNRMIAPLIVQILFWVGVVVCVIAGLFMIFSFSSVGTTIQGLLTVLLGPLVVRLYCELLMIWFRIYDRLSEISAHTKKA